VKKVGIPRHQVALEDRGVRIQHLLAILAHDLIAIICSHAGRWQAKIAVGDGARAAWP